MDGLESLVSLAGGLGAAYAIYRWQRSLRHSLDAANCNNEHFLFWTAMNDASDPRRSAAALRRLTRRLEKRPRDGLSYLQRAVIHHASGRIPEAIEDFSQFLLLRPTHVAALMNRAHLWEASGENESAIADLDQVLALEPSNGSALVLRAKLLNRQGRRTEALADFDQVRRLPLREQPDRLDRVRLRLELQHDLDSGESELSKELEADPDLISARYLRGLLRTEAGRTAEARADFELAARSAGGTRETLRYRAYALWNLRRWEAATAELAAHLEADPDDHQAREYRAFALLYLGAIDSSLFEWNELIRRQPHSPHPLVCRSMLHGDAARYHEAERDLRSALRHDPDCSAALNALAWLYSGCPSARFRNGPEAVRLATRACELTHWEDGNVLETLATAYAECGRFDEAVHWEEQAQSKMSPAVLARWGFLLELYRAGKSYRSAPGDFLKETLACLGDAARADG